MVLEPNYNRKEIEEFQALLKQGDFSDAYNAMKRNPLLPLTIEDGQVLLDNIYALVPTQDKTREQIEKQVQVVGCHKILNSHLNPFFVTYCS